MCTLMLQTSLHNIIFLLLLFSFFFAPLIFMEYENMTKKCILHWEMKHCTAVAAVHSTDATNKSFISFSQMHNNMWIIIICFTFINALKISSSTAHSYMKNWGREGKVGVVFLNSRELTNVFSISTSQQTKNHVKIVYMYIYKYDNKKIWTKLYIFLNFLTCLHRKKEEKTTTTKYSKRRTWRWFRKK